MCEKLICLLSYSNGVHMSSMREYWSVCRWSADHNYIQVEVVQFLYYVNSLRINKHRRGIPALTAQARLPNFLQTLGKHPHRFTVISSSNKEQKIREIYGLSFFVCACHSEALFNGITAQRQISCEIQFSVFPLHHTGCWLMTRSLNSPLRALGRNVLIFCQIWMMPRCWSIHTRRIRMMKAEQERSLCALMNLLASIWRDMRNTNRDETYTERRSIFTDTSFNLEWSPNYECSHIENSQILIAASAVSSIQTFASHFNSCRCLINLFLWSEELSHNIVGWHWDL